MKHHYGFIRRRLAMLGLGPPIGGRRRYRALHECLVSRGWQLDTESGDPCWTYPPAYDGAATALNHAELDVPDLADLGPLRPTVYLSEDNITVIGHGTWNGCERHREQRWTFPHGKAGNMSLLGTLLTDVEQTSRTADAPSYQDCVVTGPCGAWLRQWRAEGGPWPGQ